MAEKQNFILFFFLGRDLQWRESDRKQWNLQRRESDRQQMDLQRQQFWTEEICNCATENRYGP